jgi:ABC-2 type transport system permease protein
MAAYRADFFISFAISILSNMLIPLLTALIYMAGASFPGWSFTEALTIQSVYMLCVGVGGVLYSNMVWIVMQHVREGTFDIVLLKPGPTAFIVAAGAFSIGDAGTFIGGLAMFIYSVANLPNPPAILQWLQFFMLFAIGLCMNLGCVLLMSASTFKWVGNGRINEIFDAVTMFGRYPSTIFTKALRSASAFVIPVAMMGFFPAAAVMGRAGAETFIACAPCLVFLLAGYAVFNRMIRMYQSAGG